MSSTVSALYASNLAVVETFSDAAAADNGATWSGLSESGTLTASTTVPATKHAYFSKTLSGTTGTIDLTALPGITAEETVVGTGLKVQLVKFRNKSTNANKMSIGKGGSSGYGLNAAGDTWSVMLDPGQSVIFILDDTAPDVAAGTKNWDLVGTSTQIMEVHIVLG